MSRSAVCPACDSTQEVQHAGTFRRHGTEDLDVCPGSGIAAPVRQSPQGGWRVVLTTRDDGDVTGPIRLGAYHDERSGIDEADLRRRWNISPEVARRVDYLSPDDVADAQRLDAGRQRQATEIDVAGAALIRGRP